MSWSAVGERVGRDEVASIEAPPDVRPRSEKPAPDAHVEAARAAAEAIIASGALGTGKTTKFSVSLSGRKGDPGLPDSISVTVTRA